MGWEKDWQACIFQKLIIKCVAPSPVPRWWLSRNGKCMAIGIPAPGAGGNVVNVGTVVLWRAQWTESYLR